MARYAYRLETRRVKEEDFPYKTGQFTSPEKVKEFLSILDTFDNEQMIVLLLDTKNKLVGMCRQSGTIDQTSVYPREIAKHALLSGAISIILAHNHPSGDVTPSGADRDITKRVKDAMELLQIKLHDHFIVGDNGEIYSFAENGLI